MVGRADPALARNVPRVMPAAATPLTDQVGAGGMGTVWRAWDRHERRWVAAKLLAGGPGRHDAAALERFVREQAPARAAPSRRPADRLRAPTQPAATLFTMDLVRGGSLEQLLARHGPLPDSYVRVVLEQTLEALVAVHAAGVVHRDVKPGNLLLEPTGTGRPWVRLGDFGVAVAQRDARLTRVPGVVGTGGVPGPRAGRRGAARPASGPVRRRGGRHRAADRRATGPASTRRPLGACSWPG